MIRYQPEATATSKWRRPYDPRNPEPTGSRFQPDYHPCKWDLGHHTHRTTEQHLLDLEDDMVEWSAYIEAQGANTGETWSMVSAWAKPMRPKRPKTPARGPACLAHDTLVKMADGSHLEIQNTAGQLIWHSDHGPLQVKRVHIFDTKQEEPPLR